MSSWAGHFKQTSWQICFKTASSCIDLQIQEEECSCPEIYFKTLLRFFRLSRRNAYCALCHCVTVDMLSKLLSRHKEVGGGRTKERTKGTKITFYLLGLAAIMAHQIKPALCQHHSRQYLLRIWVLVQDARTDGAIDPAGAMHSKIFCSRDF